jgi:tetratricopeptide (TPR) repeat protein
LKRLFEPFLSIEFRNLLNSYLSLNKCVILVYKFKGGAAFMIQDIGGQMPLFRARLMLEEGQADRALPVLEAFQTEDEKERQEKAYLLGWCYISSKRWDDAVSVLSPLPNYVEGDGGEESRPERVRLAHCLLRLGVAAVNLAQYEDASRHFTRCLKILNDKKMQLPIARLKARYGLAMTYLMRGQYPAAIQHYELALGLCLHLDDDEERGNIYYGICDAYRRSGDLMRQSVGIV